MNRARVSAIELFFDLVFVFTVTQLTHLIDRANGPDDFVRALVVLVLIWWMYAGYAWLTNGVGAPRPMRLVLIAGAAGFLVISQAIPKSFGEDTLAFGLAYLFVVALHLGAFALQGGPGIGRAMLKLAPYNLGAALLVVLAAFLSIPWRFALFAAAAALFVLATLMRREQGFAVHPGHFVERHGLVIMIVLGESVVAIGAGIGERALDGETAAEIALSLLLIAGLWWTYFDRDDERAEHAMVAADPIARARMAILGYWTRHGCYRAGSPPTSPAMCSSAACLACGRSRGAPPGRSSHCRSGFLAARSARWPSWSRFPCFSPVCLPPSGSPQRPRTPAAQCAQRSSALSPSNAPMSCTASGRL